jgi:uncharacterized repeat protein (TIGR03803 family)
VAILALALSAGTVRGQSYEVLHAFSAEAGNPTAALVRGADGRLYGTALLGGYSGLGSVFVLTPDGTGGFTFATLHSFSGGDGGGPYAGLIQATNGDFYGTTSGLGPGVPPTAFRMDASGDVTTLHVFAVDEGPLFYAALLQAADGTFYGVKEIGGSHYDGAIFQMDAAGNVTTVHAFTGADGSRPSGLIQGMDGKFYGTTEAGGANGLGTVFKMDSAGNVITLHSFSGSDGISPYAPLIQTSDGSFWGTTTQGGEVGYGTVFQMDAAGNVIALHSFDSAEALYPYAPLLQGRDGMFYGTAVAGGAIGAGSVFRMDSAGNMVVLHSFAAEDGYNPFAGLIQGPDGTFYGATARGGGVSPWNPGTVFRMDAAGKVTTLHSFVTNGGNAPFAPLVRTPDGSFYGTTSIGGASNSGIVFRLDAAGVFTPLHSFVARIPPGLFLAATSSLMLAADGDLYGTTRFGIGNGGTIFRMDTSGNVTTLHAFTGDDGASPNGPLIQATDASFYGATEAGGPEGFGGAGTAFRMDPSGDVTTLHFFSTTDGGGFHPFAGLLRAADGFFYGTALRGGSSSRGVVFRMASSGDVTTLHSFDGTDGAIPAAPLIQASDGAFYGTAFATVFRMDGSGHVTPLHVFSEIELFGLTSGLIEGKDGAFYGTTAEGGDHGAGTIFKMEACGNVSTLHSFDGKDGSAPFASLLQAPDGRLYGTATAGGPGRGGVMYRLTLGSQPMAPGPAQIWVGLKNSDDAGTNFDLKAEVLRNGCTVIGSGQVENVSGGGSGFGSAIQRAISIAVPDSLKGWLSPGDALSIRLSVRVGATGHRSGTARLWFNDAAAKTRFDVTIGGTATSFYLMDGYQLGASPGPGPKKTIDVFVDRAAGGNPWKPFGTWSRNF